MPGHRLNHARNVCLDCGRGVKEMLEAGTMECPGEPGNIHQALKTITAGIIRDASGLGDPGWEPSHEQFRAAIVKVAKTLLWECYWTHNSKRSPEGFPDLVMVRERMLIRELKVPPDKPTPMQTYWGKRLEYAGVDYGLWMPSDWYEIAETLERYAPSPHLEGLPRFCDLPAPPDRR